MIKARKRLRRSAARIHRIREVKNGVEYASYRVTWYEGTERKRQRFATKSSADEHAARINAAEHSTESFRLLVTPEQAASVARAEELLHPTGTKIEVACAEYAAAVQKLGGTPLSAVVDHWIESRGSIQSQPIRTAVDEFLKSKGQDGTGERQISTLRLILEQFKEGFPGDCAGMTSRRIDEYLRRNQEERKWSGLTRNHHRSGISNFANWCKQRGYLPRNWSEMEFVPKARHDRGAVRIFTPEEGSTLLQASQGPLRVLLSVGMFAGVRPSEICRLTWGDFDFDRGEIHVGKQKVRTAGHRMAPLLDPLRNILEPISGQTSAPIYPHSEGYANHQLPALAQRCGVEWIPDGLRHSFVSYRIAVIRDIFRVSEETGTNPTTLRRFYRKPISEETARRWFEIRPESGPKTI